MEDADRYIVTFTKAKGYNQDGLCKRASYTVTLSVNTTNTSMAIGKEVGTDDKGTMLRAFTTYFITVAAESDILGGSDGSDTIKLTTPYTSKIATKSTIGNIAFVFCRSCETSTPC